MTQFRENIAAIRTGIRADFAESNFVDKAVFTGSMALLAVHEFGMETGLFYTATHLAEATGNNPFITGLGTAALSLAIELPLTYGVAYSIESFKNTMGEVRDRYFGNAASETGVADNAVLALTLGSPGVIINDYTKRPDKTHQEHVKTGLRTARNLAIFNGSWAFLYAGGNLVANYTGHEGISESITAVGESPLTYVALLGAFIGFRIRNSITGRKRRAAALAAEINDTEE